ncbi:hypothetical protein NKH77_21105 [Streptomyces sp. M19]
MGGRAGLRGGAGPSARILTRIRDAWPDWDRVAERLAAAGARVEAVPYPEPRYPGEELLRGQA